MAQRDRQAPPAMLGDDTQRLDLGGAGRLVEPDGATCGCLAVVVVMTRSPGWVVGPEALGAPELVGVEAARGVARAAGRCSGANGSAAGSHAARWASTRTSSLTDIASCSS